MTRQPTHSTMWEPKRLHSGRSIPGIAFGTAYTSKEDLGPRVHLAIQAGFRHFDTAQGKAYDNEQQLGEALATCGVPRSDLFICTKWSNHTETTPLEACRASLKLLGMDYVDLYLIHQPRNCNGDIPGTWKLVEKIKEMGLAREIGVCNFKYDDLKTLLDSCTIPPAVNQIYFSPNCYASAKPLLELAQQHGVVIEAYWMLRSLTDEEPQPIVKAASDIAGKRGCRPDQVLLAWGATKGVIPITSSSRLDRLQGYMDGANVKLNEDDIASIEAAGAQADGDLPWSHP